MHKRGQITLFMILAIVAIALILLLLFVFPKKAKIREEPLNPEAYLQDCINPVLEPLVEKLASQGGSLELGHCIFYKNVCRHYLCYTTTPYTPCVNQEPLLKEKIETLLKEKLERDNVVARCIEKLKEDAKRKGYEVSTCAAPSFSVNLTPKKVNVPIKCRVRLEKAESTKEFQEFNPYLEWPLFDFVIVAKEIVNEEIVDGTFDPFYYMLRHYSIEIEKFRTSEGSVIYILRERTSGKEFGFAIRNRVLPGGIF